MGLLSDGSFNIGAIAKQSGKAFAQRSSGNLNRIKQMNYQRSGQRGIKPVNIQGRIGLSARGKSALQTARSGAFDLITSLNIGVS